jgi:hypothetical protein
MRCQSALQLGPHELRYIHAFWLRLLIYSTQILKMSLRCSTNVRNDASRNTHCHLMMGTEWFPETLCFLSELTRLTAREDFITSCRRESFKSHITWLLSTYVFLLYLP